MLVASRLEGIARSVTVGSRSDVIRDYFLRALDRLDWSAYTDKIVVIKGCGGEIVPKSAYAIATTRLQRVCRKLMYGEPCSSVPIWRRPRASTEDDGSKTDSLGKSTAP